MPGSALNATIFRSVAAAKEYLFPDGRFTQHLQELLNASGESPFLSDTPHMGGATSG